MLLELEAVFDTPQDGLGSTGYPDLAIATADVRLDRVHAQEHELCDLGVALSLGDESDDLCFPIGEPFGPSRPIQTGRTAGFARSRADHDLAAMDPLERCDQFPGGQGGVLYLIRMRMNSPAEG